MDRLGSLTGQAELWRRGCLLRGLLPAKQSWKKRVSGEHQTGWRGCRVQRTYLVN